LKIDIVPFSEAFTTTWDDWCHSAYNGTFLHTRRFLSYHHDRFVDASVLLFESGNLVGVMPVARRHNEETLFTSHPGATYGGIVRSQWLSGERLVQAFECLREYYRAQGGLKLIYKPVPFIYATHPSQDDLYALFRVNAQCVRRDLACVIDLNATRYVSERRRRSFKKAAQAVTLAARNQKMAEFWQVLEDNLACKHQARPVHSLEEILLLAERFPDTIQLRCALIDNEVHAGILLFCSQRVWHAQYIASSAQGYDVSALDAVVESIVRDAQAAGIRYFSFGTSNENEGWTLNEGLYRFKSEFGGGGVAHEYFEVTL
jgi:hypothetical protein